MNRKYISVSTFLIGLILSCFVTCYAVSPRALSAEAIGGCPSSGPFCGSSASMDCSELGDCADYTWHYCAGEGGGLCMCFWDMPCGTVGYPSECGQANGTCSCSY